ncbi:MAG: hypothetical protein HQK61_04305 [Desulfamplus sp.]|nr:hypothetical protein [Desulfamplus sp.]
MLNKIISGDIKQKTSIKRVSLDEIDLSDETFRISSDNISCHNTSCGKDSNSANTSFTNDTSSVGNTLSSVDSSLSSVDNPLFALAASINSIGLINLPVLRKTNSGSRKAQNGSYFQIICGFRRVQAMKSVGMSDSLAAVLEYQESHEVPKPEYEESHDKELFCAILAIADNAFQRPLTVMEQARGILLLKRFLSVERIASASPAIFNSTMNHSLVNMLGDLAQMDRSVHELIDQERIAMGPALKLKSRDAESLDAFVTLFSRIRTGLNKQKEIITHIIEIAAREDISICDVIKSDDIREIIGDDMDDNKSENQNRKGAVPDRKDVDDTHKGIDGNRKAVDDTRKGIHENRKVVDNARNSVDENRKGNLVRALLFKRRYPNIAKAMEKFAINLRNLKLKNDLRLDPPVDFEGRDYTFTFKVSSVEEMAKKVEMLSEVSKNPLIAKILS